MTLDIIPAVLVDESDTTIYVPDRELKEWILSNPKKHIERISELNEAGQKLAAIAADELAEVVDELAAEEDK
jgi:hypothetical protein